MAITKGLFGFDPYEVQQQQTQRLLAPITQASNPYERIGASLGTILGASMFDIKDPRLAKASKITAITKQVMGEDMNPTDPELPTKLQNLSKALFDEGEVDAAMYALEQAQKFMPKAETVAVAPGGTLVDKRTGKVVFQAPDRDKEVKLANRLVELDTKLSTEGLSPSEIAEKNAIEKVLKLQSPKGITVDARGTQAKEVSKNKADLSTALEKQAIDADTQLTNATTINSVLDRAFTGVASGAVLKVGQIADALGVTVSGTTESEQLNQLLAKLAQGQAKSLPGPLSEKELTFLREAIGTSGATKETLRNVVKRIQQDAYTTVIANNKLQAYQSEGKDLNKFDFAKNTREARKLANLLEKASPEQRQQILGY